LTEKSSLRLIPDSQPMQLKDLGDDDLMRLAKLDRQDAFEVIVRRYQNLVLGLITRFFGEKDFARDIAQDVFLCLWAERSRYQARGLFRSYLVAMTLNRCRCVARSRKRQILLFSKSTRIDDRPINYPDLPLDELIERQRNQEVHKALTQLPEKCREVMILRFTQLRSLEEICELTGNPMGTVKSHLFRGVKQLHHMLQKV